MIFGMGVGVIVHGMDDNDGASPIMPDITLRNKQRVRFDYLRETT